MVTDSNFKANLQLIKIKKNLDKKNQSVYTQHPIDICSVQISFTVSEQNDIVQFKLGTLFSYWHPYCCSGKYNVTDK